MRFLVAAALASLATVSAKQHHHHKSDAARNLSQAMPFSDKQMEDMFTSFIKQYEKKYVHDDFFARFNVFKVNAEKIRAHNARGVSYTMGLNQFADMSWEEFRASRLGFKNVDRALLRSLNTDPELEARAADAPDSVDWRTKNAVTPVKDQGQCGSCWSFSTTGSVEGAYAIKTGKLVSLSEQQLVDCSTEQGNQGCNGGLMDDAFEYIISNKGLTTEALYPYTATGPNTCTFDATKTPVAATITSYKDVTAGSETALQAAVAVQPVSVAIEADQEAFQFYSGGVLTAACGTNLDHGVLTVGYGTDGTNPYWIVKNSWGASWGEEGYIRLVRGKNECGLTNAASYPIA